MNPKSRPFHIDESPLVIVVTTERETMAFSLEPAIGRLVHQRVILPFLQDIQFIDVEIDDLATSPSAISSQ